MSCTIFFAISSHGKLKSATVIASEYGFTMNTSKRDSLSANVYEASKGELRKDVHFNQSKLRKFRNQTNPGASEIDLVIDEEDESSNDLFRNRGRAIPPDEVLGSINTTGVKIPIKTREQLPEQIPSGELLEVLHYYASKKVSESQLSRRCERSLDETALLAFGMLVDEWADELTDKTTALMFAEGAESSDEQLEHGSSADSDRSRDEDPRNSDNESRSEENTNSSTEGSNESDIN